MPTSRRAQPRLGELRAAGWRSRTVKDELRANLLARLAAGDEVLPGRRRLRRTPSIPAIENAILAGQDLVFLGERGQAKTRMARAAGRACSTSGCPSCAAASSTTTHSPRSARPPGRIVEREGDETAHRLAAPRPPLRREAGHARHHDRRPHRRGRPDQGRRGSLPVGRADAALRPDPARQPRDRRDQRAARPRRADPGRPAQHPRGARRPDPRLHRPAAARPVRGRLGQPGGLHLARPDHHARSRTASDRRSGRTTRGRSSTRWRSSARRSTASSPRTGCRRWSCPPFMEELVAELTHLARRSPGDQPAVGRQRPRLGREHRGPRGRGAQAGRPARRAARVRRAISDLGAVVASTVGKVELESVGDESPEERIVERLITKALYATFSRHVDARRARAGRRGVRGRVHGRDRRAHAVARVRGLDARGARA